MKAKRKQTTATSIFNNTTFRQNLNNCLFTGHIVPKVKYPHKSIIKCKHKIQSVLRSVVLYLLRTDSTILDLTKLLQCIIKL
jgi:hypothetical protein